MRADARLRTVYVDARWPALVRTLVLLGCPVELAPDVVRRRAGALPAGLAARPSRTTSTRSSHRAVVDAWAERRRRAWWASCRPRPSGPDLLAALDRLTPGRPAPAGAAPVRSTSTPAQAADVAGPERRRGLPDTPYAMALRPG